MLCLCRVDHSYVNQGAVGDRILGGSRNLQLKTQQEHAGLKKKTAEQIGCLKKSTQMETFGKDKLGDCGKKTLGQSAGLLRISGKKNLLLSSSSLGENQAQK